jgi:hypothetical protein
MLFPNPNGKIIAVIGSREFADKKLLYDYLTPRRDKIKLIVSGGARGADTLAVKFATDFGIPYLVFPALWHDLETGVFNKGAGFKRNWFIISNCDVVIPFIKKGGSKGTQNSIDIAKQLGKPVKIIEFEPIETL